MANVVFKLNTGTLPVGTGTVVAILDVDKATDYHASEWVHDPDLSAVAGLSIEYWKLVGDAVEAMTMAERALIDAPKFAEASAAKRAAIDENTRAVIGKGFQHAGKVFSLSREAQIYFSNMYVARDILTVMRAFPLTVNTRDDLDTHDVADAVEATVMYTTAVGTVKAALGSGTDLKQLVRAATTQAELDAIVDAR